MVNKEFDIDKLFDNIQKTIEKYAKNIKMEFEIETVMCKVFRIKILRNIKYYKVADELRETLIKQEYKINYEKDGTIYIGNWTYQHEWSAYV